ncbi:MAG: GyrI-like domain-containing protein [Bacteroidota bacterium]
MKIIKRIFLALAILLILIVVVSLFLPSKVYVERKITISSSKEVIFEQINTLSNWNKWSPWFKLDTAMKLSFNEIPSGKGATYHWESKQKNVGNGGLLITDSKPCESIEMDINFGDKGNAKAGFNFVQKMETVDVIWWMKLDLGWNPIAKYFGLFMDKFIGNDYEKGLSTLKTLCEKLPKLSIEESTVNQSYYLGITDSCSDKEIGKKFGPMYAEIMSTIEKNKIKVAGAPLAIYSVYTPEKIVFEAGIPIEKAIPSKGKVKCHVLKAGKVVVADYYGAYEKVGVAHKAINKWLSAKNKLVIGFPWEVYVTDPQSVPDTNKWLTKVYYPIQ